MRMFKKMLMMIVTLLFFTFIIKADIPPPKGYSKIRVNCVIETNEDLSDYRFFFDFSGALSEVEVKSNGKTSIPPIGGGARYTSGDLIAIPGKNLEVFGKELTYEQLNSLSESIRTKQIEGIIELGAHTFTQTVKGSGGNSSKNYVIIRKDNTLQMSPKKKTTVKKKVSSLFGFNEEETYAENNKNSAVGGVFLSLFFLTGGIFVFRKSQS